jgi:hypothetical protein
MLIQPYENLGGILGGTQCEMGLGGTQCEC